MKTHISERSHTDSF